MGAFEIFQTIVLIMMIAILVICIYWIYTEKIMTWHSGMPEEDGEYFVTTTDGKLKVDEVYHREWQGYDVKAWMKMPLPCR